MYYWVYSPWDPIKASLKHLHSPETPLVWRWSPQKTTPQGHYCSHTPSALQLVALRELQAEGLGLERSPAPSEQGHNSLWPQSAAATSLSVGTANKTSIEVAKG